MISCSPEKKSKPKNNDDVRKVVISDKMQETKIIFCPPKKKSKAKNKNNDEFGTSLFLIKYRMRCVIYIPLMQKTLQ